MRSKWSNFEMKIAIDNMDMKPNRKLINRRHVERLGSRIKTE